MPKPKDPPFRLALFCSGGGTNAEQLMLRFARHTYIRVMLMVVNKDGIGAIARAQKFHVPVEVIDKGKFTDDAALLDILKGYGIDYIALAGYMRKIPKGVVEAYPQQIFNVHPALLPKFGGKGMYGSHVHQAVIRAGEKESGMTIHLVDAEYDKGPILYQARCSVGSKDTAEDLQQKVQALEWELYGHVIESYIEKQEGIQPE